jgi:hypothetical protein
VTAQSASPLATRRAAYEGIKGAVVEAIKARLAAFQPAH